MLTEEERLTTEVQKKQKRRGAKYDQMPERVENAAQSMRNGPPGITRGYHPSEFQTGRTPAYPGEEGFPQGDFVQGGHPQGGFGAASWNGSVPGAGPLPVRFPPTPAGSGSGQNRVNATGAYRGFVAPPAGPVSPNRGNQGNPGNQGNQPPKKKGKALPAMLITLLVLVIGAGGAFGIQAWLENKKITEKVAPYDQLFCPGVYVDGIDLGGMTPEQAMNSVQSQIRRRNDAWSVTLTYQNQTLATINAQMLGMSVDVGDVMNHAWMQGHTGTAEERYRAMLELEERPYEAYTAIPSGDTSVIDSLLEQIRASIEVAPQDAELVTFDTTQSYPFVFRDEVFGKSLDTAPVLKQIYRKVALLESGSIELEPRTIDPQVRKNDLIRHYMLRSSVYTPISRNSTEERNNNIRRAFEFINGYVLQPGKTFSFNGVVGERTEKNGFFPAIEYAYGEHVMGIGGGVCQASTTLYQAAVCAGLSIVKREPHSDAVSYTEYGKDATVYWGDRKKIDFSFRNSTDEPIYIVAAVETDPTNKRRLIAKISMYGKDMGDVRYEIETQEVSTIEPPEEPKYIKDTAGTYVTYTDQQKSVAKAKEGHVIQSYRLEYTGNVLTDRVELFRDVYEAQPERIYVGVKSR